MSNDVTFNQLATTLKTTKNRVKYFARLLDAEKCYKDSNGVHRVTPDGARIIAEKIASVDTRKAVEQPPQPVATTYNQLERLKTTPTTATRANNHYTTPETINRPLSTAENNGAANSGQRVNSNTDATIAELRTQIALLREQVELKDKQIERLTNAVERAQEALEREQAALERAQMMQAAATLNEGGKKRGLLAALFHKKKDAQM